MDLELLGKIAVELSVHSHPTVKRSFERLVESVGTKRFAEDYCALQKFLMKLHHQVQLTNEFSYFHSGSPCFTWALPGNGNFSATTTTPTNSIGAASFNGDSLSGAQSSSTPQSFVNFSLGPTDQHHHGHQQYFQNSLSSSQGTRKPDSNRLVTTSSTTTTPPLPNNQTLSTSLKELQDETVKYGFKAKTCAIIFKVSF